jgi:uncharacterized sporulation protein YeaH/YhbH (DUF444 family)
MSYIVDRRRNAKNKSTVNRQRFLDRYRGHIKRAVTDAVSERSITDMERGEEISIPGDDISEPRFHHGNGGRRSVVHPGNKEFVSGDKIQRPKGGGGSGGKASQDGEGDDEFVFQLSQEEFLNFLFDDLELPNLVKRNLKGNDSFKYQHAGFATEGNPSKLSILRSMHASKGRRIALTGQARRQKSQAEDELLEAQANGDELGAHRLKEEVKRLERRIARVPFLDTTDLRYNLHQRVPVPTSQAVMFCLMDVSGSMDQHTKDIAKRFYLLLYLFLKRHYERTEVVFIRHHTTAKEVDEQTFFYSRETGGTVVSSALQLMADIVEERYSADSWNIYGAQASDGDNWADDSPRCISLLEDRLLPLAQYFAYVEITRRPPQELWRHYLQLEQAHPGLFAQRRIQRPEEIFPVFHELFQKRQAA